MLRLCAISDEISSTLEGALDLICEWGLHDIEIHTLWGTSAEELSAARVTRLREVLADRGLCLAALDSTVFLRCSLHGDQVPESWGGFQAMGGTYAQHLAALEGCLEIAGQLEAPIVRIFGFAGGGEFTEEVAEEIAERLARPVSLARQAGVILALENCPHSYLPHTRHVLRILELVNSPHLQLLWDPSNAYRRGELDVSELAPAALPFLAHMHVKGVVVDKVANRGREYVVIGRGQVNYHRLLGEVKAAGYTGAISLEPHYALPAGGLEEAARESFASLLGIVNSL